MELQPARVARILAERGLLRAPRHDFLDQVVAAVPHVAELPGEPVPTWVVGEHRVRRASHGLTCSCAGRDCAHVAAVHIAHSLEDPHTRWLLEAPEWEVALATLSRPPPARRPGEGRIRYVVSRPSPGLPGVDVQPEVVLGERVVRYPRELDGLTRLLTPTDADLEVHPAWHALQQARQLERNRRPVVTRQLARALLGPLSRVDEVRFEGRRVRVTAEPLRPHVVAERTARGLALRWEPGVAVHWDDVGIVLTQGGVLCPLVADLPEGVAERLGTPLPDVPAADVERFVDIVVVDRGLEVALPDGVGLIREPDAREARLVLVEDGATLHVRLDLAYLRGGAEAVAREPGPTLQLPNAGLVRRDPHWEQHTRERFAAELGHPEQTTFHGDDALDLLTRRLPELRERWLIFGEDGLVHLRTHGRLSPSVQVSAGEDWFDLDVRFEAGGRKLPAGPVIESWLRGRRYHRLDNGGVAELPARWLARHGKAVDLLLEVRRAQRKLSSWHAWQLSELLEHPPGWVTAVGAVPSQPPPPLALPLRDYQQRGYEWLCFLRDNGLHGVLADEMGLGKTAQALAAVAAPPGQPALVVAPTSVLHAWVDEAARFAPGLRVVAYHGSDRALTDADLVVTTYGLLRRDIEALAAIRWSWAILDEGHLIKNPGSQVARAACRLQADHRLILTGTPLENQLTDLWSLFRFLMPGLLGSRRAFHARYAGPAARDPGAGAITELRRRVEPFVLRRRKDAVATELPPRTEAILRVDLSPAERRLYDGLLTTIRGSLQGELKGDDWRERLHVLEALTRLRQACCHPALLPFPEARQVRRSAKVEALLEQLDQAVQGGHRCLVFSQWPTLLRRVGEALDGAGHGWLLLEGATRDRGEVVRRFQDPDGPPVMLISVKAGGTGLTLTAADVVFHLDPWWNPAVEDQATDRAHRIGQTRPVTVYKLVATDTVEEKVLALQGRKRQLFADTVDELARVTLDDLRDLIGQA